MKPHTLILMAGSLFAGYSLPDYLGLVEPVGVPSIDKKVEVRLSAEESWPKQYSIRYSKPVAIPVAKLVETKINTNDAWEKMVDGVKGFEGFRAKPYLCCGGRLTIGYGHTGIYTKKNRITQSEAEALLVEELKATKKKVLEIVKVPLTPAQLAALTSFTFNCGTGALRKLVDQPGRLNDGNYHSVEEVMPLYRKAGGKIRDGLVRRRSWELEIWNA